MVGHEMCEGCQWNEYPICTGTIIEDGTFLNIENLIAGFNCGVKDMDTIHDLRPIINSELDLLKERIDKLEKNNKKNKEV